MSGEVVWRIEFYSEEAGCGWGYFDYVHVEHATARFLEMAADYTVNSRALRELPLRYLSAAEREALR